jgi:hypothetical protein
VLWSKFGEFCGQWKCTLSTDTGGCSDREGTQSASWQPIPMMTLHGLSWFKTSVSQHRMKILNFFNISKRVNSATTFFVQPGLQANLPLYTNSLISWSLWINKSLSTVDTLMIKYCIFCLWSPPALMKGLGLANPISHIWPSSIHTQAGKRQFIIPNFTFCCRWPKYLANT